MDLRRTVSADLAIDVLTPCRLAFQVGVATPDAYDTDEQMALTAGGDPLSWQEVIAPHGGRVWIVDAPVGPVELSYRAQLVGTAPAAADGIPDELLYLRPSRYCEADRLIGFASRLFRDITEPAEILAAVSSWVGQQLDYVSGSSGPTDGAVDTLLAGAGVCRDFAHLVVALLRALGRPARLVAVYAPGLNPMDFHAVAETLVDGVWYVVDATLLAPRASLVRIATGRDAADTSFLSNYGGAIELTNVLVTATVEGALPQEDVTTLVQLG